MSVRPYLRRCAAMLLLHSSLAFAQNRVDAKHLHERAVMVVPIIGTGTYADPKRPLFAPQTEHTSAPDSLIGFSWNPSDDGRYAIVEFVARDPRVLKAILSDSRVIKAFEKGKAKKDDIENELKKYRKEFSFDDTTGRRP